MRLHRRLGDAELVSDDLVRLARDDEAQRALILNRIADRMEERLELLALVETLDNGKPIRETTAADLPLAIDHFRYFAGCIRAQEGSLSEIDQDTVAYHFHEPLSFTTVLARNISRSWWSSRNTRPWAS